MRIIKPGILFAAIYGLSVAAFAGGGGPVYATNGEKIITLSVGPAWYATSSEQTLALQPDVVKTYINDGDPRALTSAELFFALQCQIARQLYGQLGIAVAYSGTVHLNGDILEDNDPNFNNYYYHFNVNHGHVGLKGKLLGDFGYRIQPYLSASVALSFNHAYGFTITPKIIEEVPAPPFSSETLTTAAFTVGAGGQMAINRHWQVGVGYEFAYWGKTQLGPAFGQTINRGIEFTPPMTQQLQFSLSYTV